MQRTATAVALGLAWLTCLGVASRAVNGAAPDAAASAADGASAGRRLRRPCRVPRHLLLHLSQRSRPRGRAVVQPGRARRPGGPPRALGESAPEGPHRPDAAGRSPAPGPRFPRRRPDHGGRLARSRRRRQSRPRSRRRASPEPHRVSQRDSRPAEPADRRLHAAAARRSRRGLRQRRRQPCLVAVASRTLPGRGARDQPAGRWRSSPSARSPPRSPTACRSCSNRTCGSETTCRSARAAGSRCGTTSRSTANTASRFACAARSTTTSSGWDTRRSWT